MFLRPAGLLPAPVGMRSDRIPYLEELVSIAIETARQAEDAARHATDACAMARRARAAETPAARRIKRKILIAMALTAFLPMLVVAYLVYSYALPLLDPQAQERNLPWMLVMLGGDWFAFARRVVQANAICCRARTSRWSRY